MMGEKTAVTIIGGGVIGLSTAYHLARMNVGPVTLLEKEVIGDGASSRAGGIITDLLWSRTGIEARKISLALYGELSEELAEYGYRFQNVGCLNLFDVQDWAEREKLLPLYDQCHVPYEILTARDMNQRWPDLTPAEHILGLYDPLGGYSEPRHYLPALTRRCRELGVDIREGVQVTGIEVGDGRSPHITTTTGSLTADVLICTVHTWTAHLLAAHGWPLPMKAFVHQRYVTTPLPAPLRIPAVNANPQGGYLRPADGNRILAGIESAERPEFITPSPNFRMSELTTSPGLSAQLRHNMLPLLPRLAETQWQSEHVGLIAFSLDGEPLLGHLPDMPQVILGTAFHSGGFAYNPVAGLLLAELAAGRTTSVDINTFAPDRFSPQVVSDYLATAVAQKDAVCRRH
jgi:glycine/D-amino acid oxidase-like deaminating enzyme